MASSQQSPVFAGVRVLEVSRGIAGALAGLLLAENGADVVRVDPPGGDARHAAPEFHVYHRSKQAVQIDTASETGRGSLAELARNADVVICDLAPAGADARGAAYPALSAHNPRLVYVAVPPFGASGPKRDLDGDEWAVAACGGVMAEQASVDLTPTFILAPLASAATAILAASAAAIGLLHVRKHGRGQEIVASQLAGAVAGQLHNFVDVEGVKALESWRRRQPLGPNPVFTMVQTADSWMALAVLSRAFFERLCAAIGWPDLAVDPRFVAAPFEYTREEDGDALLAEMQAIFRTRPRAEWLDILRGADVPGGPVLTHAEAMDEEQVAASGVRLEIDDPTFGPTVQPDLPVRFGRSGGGVRGAFQVEATPVDDVRRRWAMFPAPAVRSESPPGSALEGLRVLDTGTYIAGTVAGGILADLGADVIKIEPPVGDPFRALGMEFLGWNRGKRAMVLDLKETPGRELLYRLVKDADVFIENFRPGVAERLGVGYDALAAINPRLVYASVSAFGPAGPRAGSPGFDLLLQSYTGAGLRQGGAADPVYHTVAFPDYGASMAAMFGILGALYEREGSGLGQRVETSLLRAAMFFQAGDFILYPGKPRDTRGGPQLRGTSPLYRLYEASDGWLFIDARGHEAHTSLHAIVAPGTELESTEAVLARRADAAPAPRFAEKFATELRATWLSRLAAGGVTAVPVLHPHDLLDDDHFRANVGVDAHDHPEMGAVRQAGPLIRPSLTPAKVQRRAPLLGEHTREVLAEAGLSPEDVEAAIEGGGAWGL